MTYINEPNLYRLIIKSRMPEAEAFEEWVMEEVLPQIRKTGQYQAIAYSTNQKDSLTKEQQDILRGLVKSQVATLPHNKQAGAMIKTWSKLKAHFKVPYREIPQEEFLEAISIVQRTAADWELVDDLPAVIEEDALKSRMMEHFEKCMSLAIEASSKAQMAIFRRLVEEDAQSLHHDRFFFSFDHEGHPRASKIKRGATIATPEELIKRIPIPGDFYATSDEIAGIAAACLERLRDRI